MLKYTETDLTEATKIIAYLRSIRMFAAALFFLSLAYSGFNIMNNPRGAELYLLYCFTGLITLGCISIILHLTSRTVNLYGISSIIAGVIYLFSLLYYQGETDVFFTTIGFVAGIIVIRQGVLVAFGARSRDAFSKENQKKVSFVINLIKSLKQSRPGDENVIHCTYIYDAAERNMIIKLLDDVVCFLLNGHSTPEFFDRNNVDISELQESTNFLHVSIVVHHHDWLEAQLKPDDFKKYQAWKKH